MNRFRMMVTLAVVAAGVALTVPAAAQRPELRVAYLHDGPVADWAQANRDSMAREVARVLATDYRVVTPPELEITARSTRESCRDGLQRLLGSPGVDVVIATGPIGSVVAAGLPERPVPVIGALILNPTIQGVPETNGRSGLRNFVYITAENLLLDDIAALDAIAEFDSLAVIGPARFLNALPAGTPLPAEVTDARAFGVRVDGPVEDIWAALPPGTDAVYLLPLVGAPTADIERLIAGFKARRLPVVSMRGHAEVNAGALLGITPRDWLQRLHRRIATLALRIVNGEQAADLPVLLPRAGQTYINARTARAVGVSPSFTVLIDAVLIDDLKAIDGRTLDIFTAMEEAQRNNQDIAVARRAVAAGAHEVSRVSSRLLPQIRAGLDGIMIDEDRANLFPQMSERTLAGNVSLTQVIWSEKEWSDYSIAKSLQEIRRQDLMRTALDVGLEAAAAYLDVLRAESDLIIQRQNLAFTRANLERAAIRVKVGDADRSEVLRWESKIAAEKADVIASVARRKSAQFALNRVLNRPLEEPFNAEQASLDDQLTLMANPRVDIFTGDPLRLETLREFLALKGLAAAPELLRLDAAIEAQQREYKSSTRSFWQPTISFDGRVDWFLSRGGAGEESATPGLPQDSNWGIGVFMSLPLLEGGGRFAEKKRTTQEVYRLQRQRLATSGRLEVRVRDAVYRAAASRLTVDLFRAAADAARRNLELVSDNYSLGQASLVDLIDSQTNALETQLAAADAVYGHLLDLMDLERAVGRFTFFASAEARAAWIDQLEAFAVER